MLILLEITFLLLRIFRFVRSRHFRCARLHLALKNARARTKTKFAALKVIFCCQLVTDQSEPNHNTLGIHLKPICTEAARDRRQDGPAKRSRPVQAVQNSAQEDGTGDPTEAYGVQVLEARTSGEHGRCREGSSGVQENTETVGVGAEVPSEAVLGEIPS